MNIPLSAQLTARIEELAKKSGTTPAAWCRVLIEDFVREHRSNKFTPDPTRHDDRNPEYVEGLYL